MKLHDAFAWMDARRSDELVVTPAGSGSRAWYNVTKDYDTTFYLNASMGLVSMFSLGLARNLPAATVWGIAGDGGVTMNPSAFATEAEFLPNNMKHIILWNRVFHATGRIPLASGGRIDFRQVAQGFGVPAERCFEYGTVEDLEANSRPFEKDFGYALIVLRIEIDPDAGLGHKADLDGAEIKYRFARGIEDRFGIEIFDKHGV